MSRPNRLFATAIVWLLAGMALAEPYQLAPQEGVLLMRTGGVLRGKISRVGDRFYVTLPDGEIRVQVAHVELFCRDLDEAYHRKRTALEGAAGPREHLELAEWCLRQELWGYAAQELLSARAADPTHPKIDLLERRLRLAVAPPAEPGFESKPPPERASTDELDQLARGLPAGTVETFTNVVQPLLLNRCSNAACHGSQAENRLRLERIATGRPLSRHMTQRNLHAALACVDRGNPSLSLLLTKPSGPHGTAAEAIFAERDVRQYRQLVDWVHQLAEKNAPPAPATVGEPVAPLLQSMDKPASGGGASVPASSTPAAEFKRTLAEKSLGDAKPQPPSIGTNLDGAPPPPGDPFDPEIFNRQFSPTDR